MRFWSPLVALNWVLSAAGKCCQTCHRIEAPAIGLKDQDEKTMGQEDGRHNGPHDRHPCAHAISALVVYLYFVALKSVPSFVHSC